MLFLTLGLFFGTSIAFRAIREATEDQPLGVTLGLEGLLLVVVVGAILAVGRRRR